MFQGESALYSSVLCNFAKKKAQTKKPKNKQNKIQTKYALFVNKEVHLVGIESLHRALINVNNNDTGLQLFAFIID